MIWQANSLLNISYTYRFPIKRISMNVLNTLQNSTNNLIHLNIGQENSKTTSPPSLLFFSIINPSLISDNNSEAIESQIKQIICYINFEEDREITDNEKVKHVGLIRGLNDFSLNFLSESDPNVDCLNHVDTDTSRIIFGHFEKQYWFICGFRFGKSNGDFIQRGLAPPDYLIDVFQRGYKLYSLNFGSIENNLKSANGKPEIEKWWQIWLSNRFEFTSFFNMNDRGFLNLLDGYRVSSVTEPLGFKDNLKLKMNELTNENEDLLDIFVLNTNWTPSKNFGSIYVNPNSLFHQDSLKDLLNLLESLDSGFGLSMYSLTSTNIPSLKTYISNLKRMNSIAADGTLFERSLLQPALFLQEQLAIRVFNPFTTAFNSVANFTTSLMPTTLVPTMPDTFVPKMNFFGLGGGGSNNTIEGDALESAISASQETNNIEPAQLLQPSESRAESRSSGLSVQESLQVADKSGNYLLGYTKDGAIVTRDVYLKDSKTLEDKRCKLIIYELNGILFGMLHNPDSLKLKESEYFETLQNKLDEIFEVYFKDLILNQLTDIEKNFNKVSSFYYVVHDHLNKTYKTSLPNIPDSSEIKELKIFAASKNQETTGSLGSRSQSINLNLNIINYLINDSSLFGLQNSEKLIKLNRFWWCLFILNNDQKILILKRFDNNHQIRFDNRNLISVFGDDVAEWYKEVIVSSGSRCTS